MVKKASKKLIVLAVAAVMLLGVFGLTACNNELALQERITALETQVTALEYSAQNGMSEADVLAEVTRLQGELEGLKAEATANGLQARVQGLEARLTTLKNGNGGNLVEIQTDDMVELHTWLFTSGVPNNAIKLKHSDASAIFECTVDKGSLSFSEEVQNKTVNPGDTLHWRAIGLTEQTFFTAILKVGDNIIGYAIVEIYQTNSPVEHDARVLKSVLFPKVDGEFQGITKQQVETIIEQIKNNSKIGDYTHEN